MSLGLSDGFGMNVMVGILVVLGFTELQQKKLFQGQGFASYMEYSFQHAICL